MGVDPQAALKLARVTMGKCEDGTEAGTAAASETRRGQRVIEFKPGDEAKATDAISHLVNTGRQKAMYRLMGAGFRHRQDDAGARHAQARATARQAAG